VKGDHRKSRQEKMTCQKGGEGKESAKEKKGKRKRLLANKWLASIRQSAWQRTLEHSRQGKKRGTLESLKIPPPDEGDHRGMGGVKEEHFVRNQRTPCEIRHIKK